jgi:uncharacterized Zn finger protein
MSTPRKERRQVNVSVSQDKRKSATERRHCPDCDGPLEKSLKRVAGGSVATLKCPKCGWSHSSRATDADVLLLKMSWALDVQTKGGYMSAVLPPELSDALKLKSGDQLLISPLTSPVGSLPMKWALSVKRAKA